METKRNPYPAIAIGAIVGAAVYLFIMVIIFKEKLQDQIPAAICSAITFSIIMFLLHRRAEKEKQPAHQKAQ